MKWLLALGVVVVWLVRRPEFRDSFKQSYSSTKDRSGVRERERDPERVKIKGVDY